MFEWDRSHDWVVHRFHLDRAELTVLFEAERPSLAELAALRRCLPEFRNVPPTTARDRARQKGRLEFGELHGPEARRLLGELRREGLRVELKTTSRVGYLPQDRTTGDALLIEDDVEARSLAEQMIESGVPVEDTYE
jgi:hypothetical protein